MQNFVVSDLNRNNVKEVYQKRLQSYIRKYSENIVFQIKKLVNFRTYHYLEINHHRITLTCTIYTHVTKSCFVRRMR